MVIDQHTISHIVVESEPPNNEIEAAPVISLTPSLAQTAITSTKQAQTTIALPRPKSFRIALAAFALLGILLTGASGYWFFFKGRREPRSTGVPVAFSPEQMKIRKLTTNGKVQRAALSPDGKLVACVYADPSVKKQIAAIPSEGGPPQKVFDAQRTANFNNGLRWTPDGAAVTYRNWADGIWRQPLTGGQPQRLKGLPQEKLYTYGWSPDGQRFAFTLATNFATWF